ncbi:hypothetical protein Krac_3387 [Ktedonobacter racemifer DSM 44963]|uniref:Uncharacterized protein n=1 Tax=Ktedonobacter racemifer DSM 44963 TaxID=485913 RepID=D6U176_KTERA|nr:hypothetical protein Krac_3387 [Ktedonobacter racemifer DSM 44963]
MPALLLGLESYSKQFSDEYRLASSLSFVYTLHLAFSEHIDDLIPLQGSLCSLKGKEAHPWFRQPFDESMVLFNLVVEILTLPEFTRGCKNPFGFQFVEGFGIRRVFILLDEVLILQHSLLWCDALKVRRIAALLISVCHCEQIDAEGPPTRRRALRMLACKGVRENGSSL